MKFLVFSSVLDMQLKGVKSMILQNLFLGSVIILRDDKMIEHDLIFVFANANS